MKINITQSKGRALRTGKAPAVEVITDADDSPEKSLKPLQWERHGENEWRAPSPLGMIQFIVIDDYICFMVNNGDYNWEYHPNESELLVSPAYLIGMSLCNDFYRKNARSGPF
jgi:hypothetical protein